MATKKTAKKDTKKAKEAEAAKILEDLAEGILIYDPTSTYKNGDQLYHKYWEDTGTVVDTGATEDGVKKMVVNFETVGEKKLIMGHLVKA